MNNLYPVNLPPPGDRASIESFGFWFRLIFFGMMAVALLLGGSFGATSMSGRVWLLSLGALSSLLPLMYVLEWSYLIPIAWSSIIVKFYLEESTASVSKRSLRAGDEFQFTYRQSFKRRTRVRKFCVALVIRAHETYEIQGEGEDDDIKRERWDDKAIVEFNQPGWQAQPGEDLQETATFKIADPPILLGSAGSVTRQNSSGYLIKVTINLNWSATFQRIYRLDVSSN